MLAILSPILVFGLVIFVHELGHFIAAKATGVYAPRFSIGFGPAIFRKRKGETEYVLAWLPLGGYVRMASRHDAETAFLEGGAEEGVTRAETDKDYDPNAMMPFGPKKVPEDRWFESKPLWARIIIMIAGVVMNIVLAVVVGAGLAYKYGESIVYQAAVIPTTVVGVVRPDSIPALSQLHVGDTIRAVNGQKVRNWNDVTARILASSPTVEFETNRGTISVPAGKPGVGILAGSIAYRLPPVIDTIFPGDPAAAAGVKRGDSITAVAGHPVSTWSEVVEHITKAPGQPVPFSIVRAGHPDSLIIVPKVVADTDALGHVTTVGRIGAGTESCAGWRDGRGSGAADRRAVDQAERQRGVQDPARHRGRRGLGTAARRPDRHHARLGGSGAKRRRRSVLSHCSAEH